MMNEQPTWYEGSRPMFGTPPSMLELGAVMYVCRWCGIPDDHDEADCDEAL